MIGHYPLTALYTVAVAAAALVFRLLAGHL